MLIERKKTKRSFDGKNTLKTYRKLSSYVFSALLVLQIFLFGGIQDLGGSLLAKSENLSRLRTDLSEIFVKDTIRTQQRSMLNSVKQGWMQYIISHPETRLLLTNENGNYIYSNEAGETIVFVEESMTKRKRPDDYYDILAADSGRILAEGVRLQWNMEAVKTILNIVASPLRAFGSTGDIMVYDSYTGEVIMNTSRNNWDVQDVFGEDGKRYLSLESSHPNNKNPEATAENYETVMMWVRDSDRNTGSIDFFNEPTDMGSEGNDFEKYPLGEYNRDFIERVILPYESVGVDGQPMHITVTLSANEREIMASYKTVNNHLDQLEDQLNEDIIKVGYTPLASVAISLAVILIAMFVLQVNAFMCTRCTYKPKDQT